MPNLLRAAAMVGLATLFLTIVAVREDVPTHKVLLSGGASAKLPDRQGVTPLDHARHRGYTSIVRIL